MTGFAMPEFDPPRMMIDQSWYNDKSLSVTERQRLHDAHETLSFARAYQIAFVDSDNGELLALQDVQIRLMVGTFMQIERDGYLQAIDDINPTDRPLLEAPVTDHNRGMIQFARSYHSAFVDHAKGELRNSENVEALLTTGLVTKTNRDGYHQAILDIMAKPVEIAPDDFSH